MYHQHVLQEMGALTEAISILWLVLVKVTDNKDLQLQLLWASGQLFLAIHDKALRQAGFQLLPVTVCC